MKIKKNIPTSIISVDITLNKRECLALEKLASINDDILREMSVGFNDEDLVIINDFYEDLPTQNEFLSN